MIKVAIQHSKSLEPFFDFYVRNSSDVLGLGWKNWVTPNQEEVYSRIKIYKDIWDKYEEKIINEICSSLNLSFKENINVYIVAGVNRSISNPIVISSHHPPKKFVTELTHELIHFIFRDEDFKFSNILAQKTNNKIINNHILVYAVLRKIFENDTEMSKLIVPSMDENYIEAYKISENYEDILSFFRENK